VQTPEEGPFIGHRLGLSITSGFSCLEPFRPLFYGVGPGLKGVFLIFPVWALFEFVYRARARQSLICPHCGFDPYLYKHDIKLARKKVELFFAEKKKQSGGAGEPSNPTNPPGHGQVTSDTKKNESH
jgi:hypothetical protein